MPSRERSARWGHAQYGWTRHSLPLLVRMLESPGKSNMIDDEQALNLFTWRTRSTKQYCKFQGELDMSAHRLVNFEKSLRAGCAALANEPQYAPVLEKLAAEDRGVASVGHEGAFLVYLASSQVMLPRFAGGC